jgi:surfactin synthase thioesterase subunit
MTRKPLLVCLPFAGAGASVFEPWRQIVGDRLDFTVLELPGHERRYNEPLCHDVMDAVEAMAPQGCADAAGREIVVLFGHSLGAVLAFELARKLVASSDPAEIRLAVSGSPGPWRKREVRASGLDDGAFLKQVSSLAGYSHPALDDPDLRELLLPILRADVEMHERYAPVIQRPVDFAITCIRGSDDGLVSREDALQWQAVTAKEMRYMEIPGSHMYLMDNRDALIAALVELCLGQAHGYDAAASVWR